MTPSADLRYRALRERKVTRKGDSTISVGGLIYMRLIIDVSFTRVTVYDATTAASALDIDHPGMRPKLTDRFDFGRYIII